ncbi:MAG: hypothetical protein KKG32_05725 [Alphaproteobacteria bacterium]|nr:hypothetical protein [Alphaproteobacteria bacterium]
MAQPGGFGQPHGRFVRKGRAGSVSREYAKTRRCRTRGEAAFDLEPSRFFRLPIENAASPLALPLRVFASSREPKIPSSTTVGHIDGLAPELAP